MTPEIGFHCVMESPDSVSLVAPPTITIAKISAATANAQTRTARKRADEASCKAIPNFPIASGPSSKGDGGPANRNPESPNDASRA